MRHAAWWFLALTGCNWVFGISKTQLTDSPAAIDAKYFDAPADAPFACPAPGGTPQFSVVLHQVPSSPCSSYTETEDHQHAVATCKGAVSETDSSQTFQPIPVFAGVMNSHPRLSPEGDELFVVMPASPSSSTIEAYRRDAGGQWQHDRTIDPGIPLGSTVYLGAPTRGPTRRMMISDYNNFTAFDAYEIELDATSAHVFYHYSMSELGVGIYLAPYLSPDGLRMYYSQQAQPMVFYDRPDLATTFASPRMVPTAPRLDESFLTSDCARLYVFSPDLQSLFWVQQQ